MTNVVLPGFEGAEKCLEVWFKPVVSDGDERQGLFKIQRYGFEIGVSGFSRIIDFYLLSSFFPITILIPKGPIGTRC